MNERDTIAPQTILVGTRRLRRLSWGWQYGMNVLVPLANHKVRVCDPHPSTAHADDRRGFGCASCSRAAEGDTALDHFTLADALAHADDVRSRIRAAFAPE